MSMRSRIVNYIAALIIIILFAFILPRMMPGDPLQAIYGNEAFVAMTPEFKAELIQRFSLDKSLNQQLKAYVISLCHGDLGYSYYYNVPVMSVILSHLPWTILLVGLSLLLSFAIGLFLGVESGYRQGHFTDRFLLTCLTLLSGFPAFFVGILMLLFFGVSLGWAPLGGALDLYANKNSLELILDVLHHLLLPVASLVLAQTIVTYMYTRSSMVTTMGEKYIRTAKAKGCPDLAIRYRHAARNSLLPVVTSTGLGFASMISGVLLVEIIFSYPGMGTLLYSSLLNRDYPLLQGILLLMAVVILLVNFLIDLVYHILDPRISHAHN
ncbi:MAG TPA: ABC transporter permease [Syntrophaceticus sp.]|jgi:peptide/nickel transport system permease protein|nr:ABC transporter permease [Syntrophaceticus sp.]